jgi:predicted anti-sigma-YlaC factor YlaD
MNCRLYQKEFDSYLEGRSGPGTKDRIEAHLRECRECREFYRIQLLAEKLITEEKQLKVNPFLSARVMHRIENPESFIQKRVSGILKPALVVLSVAAAIFLGIVMGSIPVLNRDSRPVPLELSLMNDARLESVDMLAID